MFVATTYRVTLIDGFKKQVFNCNDDQTILDAMEERGINFDGNNGRVTSGTIINHDNHKEDPILRCYPTSDCTIQTRKEF